MWGRGLKLQLGQHRRTQSNVAPHVGAWIETYVRSGILPMSQSPLMWGRGLKLSGTSVKVRGDWSSPHVGAWIETIITNFF